MKRKESKRLFIVVIWMITNGKEKKKEKKV